VNLANYMILPDKACDPLTQ